LQTPAIKFASLVANLQEEEGNQRGGGRASYRRGDVSKKAGIKGQLMGENLGVSGEKSGERLKMTVMWHCGALLSVRKKRRERVPVRDSFLGRGSFPLLGRMVSPGPLYVFSLSFLFFVFLISNSFITCSNLVQIDSTQFVNFYKIQINIVRQ
jgi:hypothetical protein